MTDYDAARIAMVDRQVRPADVTRFAIIEAMLAVPRERFVPEALRPLAYADAQLPLGPGRALLDPRCFAKLLDAAALTRADRVLVVGAAYGYGAAVIARIAGSVVALEQDPAMADAAAALMRDLGIANATVVAGPLVDGAAAAGPFEAILVEGAVARPPERLIAQLADGGRLLTVVQDGPVGQARLFARNGAGWSQRRLFDAGAPVLPGFDSAQAFVF